MQKFILKITTEDEKSLNKPDIECLILSKGLSHEFIKKAQKTDKIILIEEDVELCNELGLDGVIVDLSKSEDIKKDMAEFRGKLKDKALGIISRNRRHEAMLISENEPDFVIFRVWQDGIENSKELVEWYNEFFLIQSAVLCEDDVDFKQFKSDMVISTRF